MKIVSLVLALVILVSVTACTSNSNSQSGELVIYSGRSESLVGPIIDQFETVTGINVDVKYGSNSEIAALIIEEGDKTPSDIFLSRDVGGLETIAGMLSELSPDIMSKVPKWASSTESKWVGLSGRARVLVYNIDDVSEDELPNSLTELTDPVWKGRIGWAPGNASFQTMITVMRKMWGEEKTIEWLRGIKANDPKEYPTNTPQVVAAANGEISIGMVNHYYLFRFLKEEGNSFSARNHYLNGEGPGSLVMVSGAGIIKTSKNINEAEKFIEFMLSNLSQQYFAGETFEYPLVAGVKTHDVLKPLDEIGNSGIDNTYLSDLRGTQTLLRELNILQ